MSPMIEDTDTASPGSFTDDQSLTSEETTSSPQIRNQENGLSTRTSAPVASPGSNSVINYVGKVQKQLSHRSTVRCRTPYDRQRTQSRTSVVESVDDTTNSSIGSSVDSCSTIITEDASGMDELEENSRPGDQPQLYQQHRFPRLNAGSRSRRSTSVSSSGCSSSMDDRYCDFSPVTSISSCRCSSLSISDFDDDGFREENSVSSMYTVISSSRLYQPHHQLHHNHQNVPHHPNNTKGLFDIALKTVKLIRRNQELQIRLSQLQAETKAFIESVMANPENETLRNRFQPKTSCRTSASTLVAQK
ncbi:uncharacterized protein LOC131684483 [Topomyia yanbarensis]|uniref:uncharacterized protein LOC131684483 n=1 Tax=Topomyia yanbarensis TaxID=2498891 RepID=UPI00273C438B|nr:uncharacterized protein LOC131684483 [Topomyia yanbarensis]XP_058823394.1 uncharacterized protein LOC131684483 [Topomyia yanbarensis]XP_058823395.1 uncharacterized protein LOC131684483 [Topomyia yanbarensis]XP_058823396.1 uncharacterized protein LOC131684483 [Topomyia yanbarensis]XP_058823397.1 uncharacterized protein LOC131684483 [Topomyia yanbarensis]